MTEAAVMLVTAGSEEEAFTIGRRLVEERLVACANVVAGVRSIFRWKGKVADEGEWLLILKTRRDRVDAVEARVRELHSYDVPEVIALPVEAGSRPYLEWVVSETTGS